MTVMLVSPSKRKWLALVLLTLVFYACPAFAKYEPTINSGTNVQATTDDNPTAEPLPAEDVKVLLDIDDPTGGDEIITVHYLWADNSTALSPADVTNKATYLDDSDVWVISRSVKDFINDDSDTKRFIHTITFYNDKSTGTIIPSYSEDVVISFNVDNVAPNGAVVSIVDSSGNEITTTTSSIVDVRLYADGEPTMAYLSATPTPPSVDDSGGEDYKSDTKFSSFLGDSGGQTLYAWFKDAVENISSLPATDTVTLVNSSEGIINPSTSELDLAGFKTQTFTIVGAGDILFDWAISNPSVAEFVGASTGTRNATVQGLAEGSFVVTATPVGGGTPLPTGVINVTQSVVLGDVNDDKSIDSGDAIVVLRYSVGLAELTAAQKIAGNVTGKENNDNIDSGDAIKILRYSVGLISSFD